MDCVGLFVVVVYFFADVVLLICLIVALLMPIGCPSGLIPLCCLPILILMYCYLGCLIVIFALFVHVSCVLVFLVALECFVALVNLYFVLGRLIYG
jgi:hypothetical protein